MLDNRERFGVLYYTKHGVQITKKGWFCVGTQSPESIVWFRENLDSDDTFGITRNKRVVAFIADQEGK
jgi:hypothetical protein